MNPLNPVYTSSAVKHTYEIYYVLFTFNIYKYIELQCRYFRALGLYIKVLINYIIQRVDGTLYSYIMVRLGPSNGCICNIVYARSHVSGKDGKTWHRVTNVVSPTRRSTGGDDASMHTRD